MDYLSSPFASPAPVSGHKNWTPLLVDVLSSVSTFLCPIKVLGRPSFRIYSQIRSIHYPLITLNISANWPTASVVRTCTVFATMLLSDLFEISMTLNYCRAKRSDRLNLLSLHDDLSLLEQVRGISAEDFIKSLKAIRPSVSESDLKQYEGSLVFSDEGEGDTSRLTFPSRLE